MAISYGQFTGWVSVSYVVKSEPSCTSHKPRASYQRWLVRGDLVHGNCPHATTQSYTMFQFLKLRMRRIWGRSLTFRTLWHLMNIWPHCPELPGPDWPFSNRFLSTHQFPHFCSAMLCTTHRYFRLFADIFLMNLKTIPFILPRFWITFVGG